MSTHQNAATYRDAMEALAADDIARFLAFIDESVRWWELGSLRPIESKVELAQFVADRGVQPTGEIHDVLANDEHLVALVHSVASVAQGNVDFSYAEVLHFHEGRIAKRQVFPADVTVAQAIIDENV